jgi:hypothetical protein
VGLIDICTWILANSRKGRYFTNRCSAIKFYVLALVSDVDLDKTVHFFMNYHSFDLDLETGSCEEPTPRDHLATP